MLKASNMNRRVEDSALDSVQHENLKDALGTAIDEWDKQA